MERPLDEPTESGKPRATDEKRLARIPTTKESWNAQQKKFPDSDGCGLFTKKRENDKQKNNNENYKKIKIKKKPGHSKKHTKGALFLPISRVQTQAKRRAPQTNRTNHRHLNVTKCFRQRSVEWRTSHSAPLLCFLQLRKN